MKPNVAGLLGRCFKVTAIEVALLASLASIVSARW
jgi:hypothetical protein